MTSLLALLFISGIARADEPATSQADEVEESGEGDAFATASQALGQAEKALGVAQGVRSTVIAHDKAIIELQTKVRKLEERGAPTSDIEAAKRELAAAVKADADRAETAATRAEAAKLAAEQAATRAATSAAQAQSSATQSATSAQTSTDPAGGSGSLNSAEPTNRDELDHPLAPYGSVGVGFSWLFRQAPYSDGSVKVLQTDELSSGMLPLLVEAGVTGLDKKGRYSLGVRGVGEYNVGGGYSLVVEGVFGAFVEPTHSFRLQGSLGYQREEIPTNGTENYLDWRYNIAVGTEFVFANEHVGLLLIGRVLPANDMDDSFGGEGTAIVRALF